MVAGPDLTLRSAAAAINMAPSTLLAYLEAGTGPPARYTLGPGGRRAWLIPLVRLYAWQAARTTHPQQEQDRAAKPRRPTPKRRP